MSGGMKQRVMIAIALACSPSLLIADEPTTALDVTIQAQVLELLRVLQRETRMSVLLITHDLGVVSEMAHRVAVMYAGEIVELALRREAFFARPAHPVLARSCSKLCRRRLGEIGASAVIPGTVPSLSQEFVGCRFADRCEFAWERCRERSPAAIRDRCRAQRAVPSVSRQMQESGGSRAPAPEASASRRILPRRCNPILVAARRRRT